VCSGRFRGGRWRTVSSGFVVVRGSVSFAKGVLIFGGGFLRGKTDDVEVLTRILEESEGKLVVLQIWSSKRQELRGRSRTYHS
jgi:hypothetical protein